VLARAFSVYVRLLVLLVLATTASGCAALALPAIGASVMGDAAGGVARAGVERTMSGAMYRTFSAPLADVRDAVRQSFRDREIQITEDDLLIGGGAKIKGQALHRHITVHLESVTPALTRLKLMVRQGLFGRDRATASELIEQTVRALDEIRPAGAAFPRAP
jgi:uncharacterized protein DUF3568